MDENRPPDPSLTGTGVLERKRTPAPVSVPPTAKSWLQQLDDFRGSTIFVVLTVSIAIFTDLFVYAVIVPVVPFAFVDRMGVAEQDVQKWISVSLGVYSAGLIVAAPICGYFADKMPSRRVTLLGGLVVLIVSTVLLCVAKNIATFVVGRFIQGASGGVVWTVGLALISDVADDNNIAQLMGYPGAAMSMGLVFGPLIGGIVYERAGYYPVFGICFGILVLDVVLRILMKEPRKNHPHHSSQGSDQSFSIDATSEHSDTLEEDTEKPAATMAMVKLLQSPRILAGLLVSIVMGWLFSSFDSVLTMHVKEVFSFNSLEAALMFLCIGVPELLGPVIGYISDKYGTRWVVTGGFIAMTPLLILLRIPDQNTTRDIVVFAVILSLAGIGFACIGVPLMGELTNAVIEEESKHPGKFGHGRGFGQIYGLFNVAFAIGSLVGPFQSGFTMNSRGWGLTTISLAIISFITAFPTAYYFDGSLGPKIKNCFRRYRGD